MAKEANIKIIARIRDTYRPEDEQYQALQTAIDVLYDCSENSCNEEIRNLDELVDEEFESHSSVDGLWATFCNLQPCRTLSINQKDIIIMTKEKALNILSRLAGGATQPSWTDIKDAARVALDLLKQPSLPSNLDEAAEEYGKENTILPDNYNDGDLPDYQRWTADAFKAGAEWMAGQGETIEGTLGYGPHLQKPIIMLEGVPKFYDGHSQEVIVQIRKK